MKKSFILVLATVLSMNAFGQNFQKGSRVVNAGIGVGVIKNFGPTFTQKVGIEWGVMSVGKNGTLGLGCTLYNAYGGTSEGKVIGAYDYTVKTTRTTYKKNSHNRWVLSSGPGADLHRQGSGTADAKFAREDLKAMASCSFHYSFSEKLEAYGTFGVGIALINGLCGHFDNYEGFEQKTKKSDINTSLKKEQYDLIYSYNDLDHVDLSDYSYHKIGFACGLSVGASYSLTDRIAAFGEVGLVSGAFKGKDYAKGLDVLTLGVMYKF